MFTNRHPSAPAVARRAKPARARVAGIACTFLGIAMAASCGGDDSGAAATTAATATTSATATTAVPVTTADAPTTAAVATTSSGGGVDDFCQAEVAVEAATSSEAQDPATVSDAFDTLVATAPDDIKPAVQTAVDEAAVFLAAGGESTPAFEAAHDEVLDYAASNCGFGELTATASEYAFGGLPATFAAGPAVVTLENIGAEFHMMLIARINDDVTETIEELLALSEEEVAGKVSDAGTAFAAPGATGRTIVDLPPGRYAVVCFLPEGATPENFPAIQSGEFEGMPHAMLGMTQEMQVV